jgi:hypothetical protein
LPKTITVATENTNRRKFIEWLRQRGAPILLTPNPVENQVSFLGRTE